MNPREFKLKLLDLYSMHVYDVSDEEIEELLGTLLVRTDIAYGFNDFFSFSLLVLEDMLHELVESL